MNATPARRATPDFSVVLQPVEPQRPAGQQRQHHLHGDLDRRLRERRRPRRAPTCPRASSCSYDPDVRSPRPRTAASSSTLTVSAGTAAAGTITHPGPVARAAPLTRTAQHRPDRHRDADAELQRSSCARPAVSVAQGGSGADLHGDVTSTNGFSSAGGPQLRRPARRRDARLQPGPVTPPANGSASSTLTVHGRSATAATGTTSVPVTGVSRRARRAPPRSR